MVESGGLENRYTGNRIESSNLSFSAEKIFRNLIPKVMKKILSIFSFVLLFTFTSVFAQEGMWLLNQISKLDLEKKGLQISVDDIYSKQNEKALYKAIVSLGGGTGSFVSPDGLMLTNHHVAYSGLQRASSKDNDYIQNGFLARNKSEEIQAKGYRASVLIEMEDVTPIVLGAADKEKNPAKREKLINKKIEELINEKVNGRKDISARVADMYSGNQYILFVYKVFRDVRIVYAPPLSIGNYGGEIDNWMWPRHTGDFTYLRVYSAPDGSGADYSPDNVPYKPEVWLKVAKEGIKENDFTFIMGFPGTTTRYATSEMINWAQNNIYPFVVTNYREMIDIMDNLAEKDPEGKIRVAGLKKGLANTMKNFEGKLEGMAKTDFLNTQKVIEDELMKKIMSSKKTAGKYGTIFEDDKRVYGEAWKIKDKDNIYRLFIRFAGTPFVLANQIYFTKKESQKPEEERLDGYSDNNIKGMLFISDLAFNGYFEPVDKEFLLRTLRLAEKLPSDQKFKGLEYLKSEAKNFEEFVDMAFENSKLTTLEGAKEISKMTLEELEVSNDPFIKLARKLYDEFYQLAKFRQEFAINSADVKRRYISALMDLSKTGFYPDANGTMRFTWGLIMGYTPLANTQYPAFTTFTEMINKDKGVEPFDVPQKLKDIYKSKDYGKWVDPVLNDVPVAFVHQCDITGGNSGSPVMNSKGELIGLAFDGNYEALLSDWKYDYALQRTISVDIRYVLFITEKFANADFLLEEMGVK